MTISSVGRVPFTSAIKMVFEAVEMERWVGDFEVRRSLLFIRCRSLPESTLKIISPLVSHPQSFMTAAALAEAISLRCFLQEKQLGG